MKLLNVTTPVTFFVIEHVTLLEKWKWVWWPLFFMSILEGAVISNYHFFSALSSVLFSSGCKLRCPILSKSWVIRCKCQLLVLFYTSTSFCILWTTVQFPPFQILKSCKLFNLYQIDIVIFRSQYIVWIKKKRNIWSEISFLEVADDIFIFLKRGKGKNRSWTTIAKRGI